MNRHTDELNRLYNRLYELDKQAEKNKATRHILFTLLFIAIRLFLLYAIAKPQDIYALASILIVSVVWGTISHGIYFYLFLYHFLKAQEESSRIKYIKDEISELEKTRNKDL